MQVKELCAHLWQGTREYVDAAGRLLICLRAVKYHLGLSKLDDPPQAIKIVVWSHPVKGSFLVKRKALLGAGTRGYYLYQNTCGVAHPGLDVHLRTRECSWITIEALEDDSEFERT